MAGPENGVPERVPSRGETAALVEAELDPRRQAEQDLADAETRMREWVRTRRTYEARRVRTLRGGAAPQPGRTPHAGAAPRPPSPADMNS